MSLIQVSSSQLNSQDKSQFKYDYNKGYSFSNYFNNLLDIPANSEIALHSGQFRVKNSSQYDFSSLSQEGNFYNIRVLFSPNEASYAEVEEPNTATHNPLIVYLPKEQFFNIETIWTKIAERLRLSSIPALSNCNYTVVKSIANNEINIQLSMEVNKGNTLEEYIASPEISGFKSKKNQIELADLNQDGNYDTYQTVVKTGGGTVAYEGDEFYTSFNGIHNIKGQVLFENLNTNKLQTSLPYPALPSQHCMCLGVKRTEQDFWKKMSEASNFNYITHSPQAQWIYYLYTRCGLPKTYVAEYFYFVRGRMDGFSTGGVLPKITAPPVIDIIKFEIEDGIPYLVCIATGDIQVTLNYQIPYASLLDPLSDDWEESGATPNCVIGDDDNISAKLEIAFESNKVIFYVNDLQVEVSQSSGSTSTELELELSDVVFPLQISGYLTGVDDSVQVEFSPITTYGQLLQKNYGEQFSDFDKYVVNMMTVPSGIYNKNATQNSPTHYYPINYSEGYPQRVKPIVFDTITSTNTLDGNIYIGVGSSLSTDMEIKEPNQGVLNPNVQDKLGFVLPLFTLNQTSNTASSMLGLYTPKLLETSPFLTGIYIRLNNLPNKTTMGSLNTADSDKLISVVNRYDYTENQVGVENPIYTYNEYEKLYIALNNPNKIQVNKLDFNLVDKFGNPIKAINETTLVLHIRPASYRDFYKG